MINFKDYLFTILLVLLISSSTYSQTTQIMTYNIRYDNKQDTVNNWEDRKAGLVNQIQEYAPAILGTQEGLLHQIEFINDNLPDYKSIGVGRYDGKNLGEFCAIFYDTTQFQVLESSTFWLSETPDKASVGWDAALERICTYGLFENRITKKRIWVFNTHFDHKGEAARESSAQLILEKIEEVNVQHYPLVLMGDFNLTPYEKPILELSQQLEEAQLISKEKNKGPAGTFNGFTATSNKKIDYFFTKKLEVLSYQHLNDKLKSGKPISDHLAVLISVKPKR